jgi:hypothetical protein
MDGPMKQISVTQNQTVARRRRVLSQASHSARRISASGDELVTTPLLLSERREWGSAGLTLEKRNGGTR